MQQILTGIQSTTTPHLGNLIGAIIPAIQATKQTKKPALFFIADLHTLTTQPEPNNIRHHAYTTAATWLACGLEKHKHILYRQSRIPQVCELTWYLSCFTPYPMLANAHAFKDKSQHLANVNAGLFIYPVLMAADILLYQATHIPVGQDQQQHLEIARDIARAFNHKYQYPFFKLPQACTHKNLGLVPGTDGQKMSKSRNNTINIFSPPTILEKSIMAIQTDSTPLDQPKNPNTCPLFKIYQSIARPQDTQTMRQQYATPGFGYQQAKKQLFNYILQKFQKERQEFTYYMQNTPLLENILQEGEKKASQIAQTTLKQVRKIIGLSI